MIGEAQRRAATPGPKERDPSRGARENDRRPTAPGTRRWPPPRPPTPRARPDRRAWPRARGGGGRPARPPDADGAARPRPPRHPGPTARRCVRGRRPRCRPVRQRRTPPPRRAGGRPRGRPARARPQSGARRTAAGPGAAWRDGAELQLRPASEGTGPTSPSRRQLAVGALGLLGRAGGRPGDPVAPGGAGADLVHATTDVGGAGGELAEQRRRDAGDLRPLSGRSHPAHAEHRRQAGPQVRLVHRPCRLAMRGDPSPVARAPPAVHAVHQVRHDDVAVEVRVAVAVERVGEEPGDHAGGRDHGSFGARCAAAPRCRGAPGTRVRRRPPRCGRAPRRGRSPHPRVANSTLTDLGALNVRSSAATATRPDPIGRPLRGWRPSSSRRNSAGCSVARQPEPGRSLARPAPRRRHGQLVGEVAQVVVGPVPPDAVDPEHPAPLAQSPDPARMNGRPRNRGPAELPASGITRSPDGDAQSGIRS